MKRPSNLGDDFFQIRYEFFLNFPQKLEAYGTFFLLAPIYVADNIREKYA